MNIQADDNQDFAQIHTLIQKLQRIAKNAGHSRPLLIGIDQENGASFPRRIEACADTFLAGLTSAFSVTQNRGAGTQL